MQTSVFPREPRLRLFFGLFPPPAAADALARAAQAAHARCGGRIQRTPNLHLTLAFLGSATPAQAGELMAFTRQARIAPGTVLLDRYGAFRRAKAVWAGPDPRGADAAALAALHDGLWRDIAGLGWRRPDETFRPHVTLLRKAQDTDVSDLALEPLSWFYDRCSLVVSETGPEGSVYRILETSRA